MKPDNTEKHVKQAETIISKPRTHDTEGESAFLTKKKTHLICPIYHFSRPYRPLNIPYSTATYLDWKPFIKAFYLKVIKQYSSVSG